MSDSEKIVSAMMSKDAFSKWLGIVVIKTTPGYALLKLEIKPDFLNGFEIAHGGIAYSLADSALAFASNGHGNISVSTQTSISHFAPARLGDTLTAEAKEIHISNKLAHYQIAIRNQNEELVAQFTGAVYRTPKTWNT